MILWSTQALVYRLSMQLKQPSPTYQTSPMRTRLNALLTELTLKPIFSQGMGTISIAKNLTDQHFSLVETFCKNNEDLHEVIGVHYTYLDAGSPEDWTTYVGWHFYFEWILAPDGLNSSCPDTFLHFLLDPTCESKRHTSAAPLMSFISS